jgi:hypothetical protein
MKFAALGDMGRYRSAQRERCLKSRDLKGAIGGDIRPHTISNDPRRLEFCSSCWARPSPRRESGGSDTAHEDGDS